MRKLQQIAAFLINHNLVAVEQFDSWVENPQIIPAGEHGGDGIVLYRQTYDAVISIERYPHKKQPVELLFGLVCAWLMDNDPDRDEIAAPQTDVDILDDETADIEITISFEEDVYAVPDPAGTIVLNGVNYRLDDDVVDYAQTGAVAT